MLSSFWVASTKPGGAFVRGQGWQPWQGRGWFLAPRDRGPEAGVYCLEGHYFSAGLTAWPPNWLRSAAATLAANDSSWREAKRA